MGCNVEYFIYKAVKLCFCIRGHHYMWLVDMQISKY